MLNPRDFYEGSRIVTISLLRVWRGNMYMNERPKLRGGRGLLSVHDWVTCD